MTVCLQKQIGINDEMSANGHILQLFCLLKQGGLCKLTKFTFKNKITFLKIKMM